MDQSIPPRRAPGHSRSPSRLQSSRLAISRLSVSRLPVSRRGGLLLQLLGILILFEVVSCVVILAAVMNSGWGGSGMERELYRALAHGWWRTLLRLAEEIPRHGLAAVAWLLLTAGVLLRATLDPSRVRRLIGAGLILIPILGLLGLGLEGLALSRLRGPVVRGSARDEHKALPRDAVRLLEVLRLDEALTEEGARYLGEFDPLWSNMVLTGFLVGPPGQRAEGLVMFHAEPEMRASVGLCLAPLAGETTTLVPAAELPRFLEDPRGAFQMGVSTPGF